MASFIGDYTGKIDIKGRVVLPSAFIKQLPEGSASGFVIKKDIFENCLQLYTIEEWERQNAILRSKINPYNKEHNKFIREYYKGTAELSLDSNNRMLIPARLLEIAKIDKDVYFSGQDRKIEIWAQEVFEGINENADEFAMLAEKIMGGNLNIEF